MAKKKLDWVDDLTWTSLNAKLKEVSEKEAADMLTHERKGKRRLQFMMRMHGRFNSLRTARERKEIAQSAADAA